MKKTPVTKIDQIQAGDRLEIERRFEPFGIQEYTVKEVKITPKFGTEIMLEEKNNLYFNLEMFLQGESWVKYLYIIT